MKMKSNLISVIPINDAWVVYPVSNEKKELGPSVDKIIAIEYVMSEGWDDNSPAMLLVTMDDNGMVEKKHISEFSDGLGPIIYSRDVPCHELVDKRFKTWLNRNHAWLETLASQDVCKLNI